MENHTDLVLPTNLGAVIEVGDRGGDSFASEFNDRSCSRFPDISDIELKRRVSDSLEKGFKFLDQFIVDDINNRRKRVSEIQNG